MSEKQTTEVIQQTLAAVDLGSNSFHMIVAQMANGQLQVVDRIKEMVRLGEGLTADHSIADEVKQRASDCLARFSQRIQNLPHHSVRAVGTNTLRQVKDKGVFLDQLEKALGHPIEIIAGREEARLIYLGVAHGLASGKENRLVVDIGGGSTECILGRGMTPSSRESLFMGCVSYSRKFFPSGTISKKAMEAAIIAGRLEIRPMRNTFKAKNWQQAVGSSGTIRAIRSVLLAQGWCDDGISRKALKQLRHYLVEAGHIDNVELEGLSEDRRPVFIGGVAVLSAVFKALEIEHMSVSDLSLREGLLYEMLGGIEHEDIRDNSINALVERFSLDTSQGRRVELTSNALWTQIAMQWDLTDPEYSNLLQWAANIHEIGLIISHGSFHKHSAYIIKNADMPGFARQQQSMLAALIRGHRRKISKHLFEELSEANQEPALRLCIILRLAVLLHRGHSKAQKPLLQMRVDKQNISLDFPDNWLETHPLTRAELVREAHYLRKISYDFQFK